MARLRRNDIPHGPPAEKFVDSHADAASTDKSFISECEDGAPLQQGHSSPFQVWKSRGTWSEFFLEFNALIPCILAR